MPSQVRPDGRAVSIFRLMVGRAAVLALAVLMAFALARTAQGQYSTTTSTNHPDGSIKTQDTTTTRDDGSKSTETHTEYDGNGQPTSETQKFYNPDGTLTHESEKTWVWDPQKRLTFFEEDDDSYGGTMMPRFTRRYRIRKKYKDDKDTEGETTQEQVDSSVGGGWRDFDAYGGDTAPSTDPAQPLKPKKPRVVPPIANEPLGEEPSTGGTHAPTLAPAPGATTPGTTTPGTTTPAPETPKTQPTPAPTPAPKTTPGGASGALGGELKTIAVAMPANAEGGDTITGTATDDPTEIAEMQEIPGIHITLVPVPQAQTSTTTTPQNSGVETLAGVVVQVNGEKQPADKPLVAMIPQMARTITVELLANDDEARVIGQDSVPVTDATPGGTAAATTGTGSGGTGAADDYDMPPVTKPGAVEVIHGAESGNANDTQIVVDGEPAKILTSTPRSIFFRVPADLQAKTQTLTLTRSDPAGGAPKTVSFRIYPVSIGMAADTTLTKGQSTPIHITVSIPQDVPATAWQAGTPPADLVDLKTLDDGKSGLKVPKANDEGSIVVLIEDETPGVIRLGKKNSIVLQLHQKDFVNGTYTYNGTMQTVHAGAFVVRSRVVGFVKAAAGQASMSTGN